MRGFQRPPGHGVGVVKAHSCTHALSIRVRSQNLRAKVLPVLLWGGARLDSRPEVISTAVATATRGTRLMMHACRFLKEGWVEWHRRLRREPRSTLTKTTRSEYIAFVVRGHARLARWSCWPSAPPALSSGGLRWLSAADVEGVASRGPPAPMIGGALLMGNALVAQR